MDGPDDRAAIGASVAEIQQLWSQVTFDLLGYPPDEHAVRPPAALDETAVLALPDSLAAFYAICDGLELPDVHNGYWVDPAERVIALRERSDTPTRIDGSTETITAFGSDGGGGRFAVADESGRVLYLPSDGGVHDHVFTYISEREAPKKVAESVAGFLERLRDDVRAFVQQDADWTFLGR